MKQVLFILSVIISLSTFCCANGEVENSYTFNDGSRKLIEKVDVVVLCDVIETGEKRDFKAIKVLKGNYSLESFKSVSSQDWLSGIEGEKTIYADRYLVFLIKDRAPDGQLMKSYRIVRAVSEFMSQKLAIITLHGICVGMG